MTFPALALSDFISILNASEISEEVSYIPNGGTAKTINVIVDRKQFDRFSVSDGVALKKTCEIMVANDSDSGVTSITRNHDQVMLAEYPGGTAIAWRVVDIMDVDSISWKLLLRKE